MMNRVAIDKTPSRAGGISEFVAHEQPPFYEKRPATPITQYVSAQRRTEESQGSSTRLQTTVRPPPSRFSTLPADLVNKYSLQRTNEPR
jgi:hypothetical protein